MPWKKEWNSFLDYSIYFSQRIPSEGSVFGGNMREKVTAHPAIWLAGMAVLFLLLSCVVILLQTAVLLREVQLQRKCWYTKGLPKCIIVKKRPLLPFVVEKSLQVTWLSFAMKVLLVALA